MSYNILKFLNGNHLKSLDNIKQWLELDRFREESVSQHSFKVAVFVLALLEDALPYTELSKEQIKFKFDALAAGLLHDTDEHYLKRDMCHSVKYNKFNGKQIKDSLDAFVGFELVNDFDCTTVNESAFMRHMMGLPEDVKLFIKICDWLGMLYYLKRERWLGNTTLVKTENYCCINLLISIQSFIDSNTVLKFDVKVFNELSFEIKILQNKLRNEYGI